MHKISFHQQPLSWKHGIVSKKGNQFEYSTLFNDTKSGSVKLFVGISPQSYFVPDRVLSENMSTLRLNER